MSARHRLEEHVGELALALEADTPAELFAEAARALAEIMGVPAPGPESVWESVALDAPDHEALLVEWLNELIFRSERSKRLYPEARIEALSGRTLAARIGGREVLEPRTAVKAATFHGLRITGAPGGLAATVILDV